jgi:hypothetical protein
MEEEVQDHEEDGWHAEQPGEEVLAHEGLLRADASPRLTIE